jgi:predicted ester cyclase
MKKYLLIFSSSALLFASCSNNKTAGISDKANKNMETNHAIIKMFESNDFSKIDQYIAKDAVDHGAGMTGGDVVGVDSIKANMMMMSKMMTDVKWETVKEMADDDYVMSWIKQTATPTMDMPEWGMKKGQPSTFNSVEVSKYKDSKVTDHWSFMSMAEMMKMMGGAGAGTDMNNMQPTVTEPSKDTTSK